MSGDSLCLVEMVRDADLIFGIPQQRSNRLGADLIIIDDENMRRHCPSLTFSVTNVVLLVGGVKRTDRIRPLWLGEAMAPDLDHTVS